jgi:acid phosphatase
MLIKFRAVGLCLYLSLLSILCGGCSTYSNLSEYKAELIQYHNSGRYEREIAQAIKPAVRHLTRRSVRPNGRLAVVLDLDDTALSDWSFTEDMYLGYNKRAFEEWAQKGSAPAIQPVLDFYKVAKNGGFKIFFISAREEHLRSATERNLYAAGYADWDGLIMRKEGGPKQSTAEFKTQARHEIQIQGFIIVENVGDQESDLIGGYSERTIKIPNPFYTVAW